MSILRNLTLALFAATLVAATLPARADAGVFIGISVGYAPPPLPVYYQPPPPAPDWLWQPGYWAWGPYGYYWVPGTWVEPPEVGLLWTPGYWGFDNGFYRWNQGFWATQVGFYGGINYGFGYFGHGYDGGEWHDHHFRYNTAVTTVNTTIVRNVYYNRTVINNYNNSTRVSYQGGRGVRAYPTATERSVALDRHLGMTSQQQAHVMVAQRNRNALATVNRGAPSTTTAARPFTANSRPANFAPIRANDRVTNTRVAPAYRAPSQPAYHAPQPARKAPQSVNRAPQPAYHAPQPAYHAPQPAYHAPQPAYHAPQPAYHAPQPAYHAPQPAYHAPQPAYHAPQPAYHAPQPAYHAPQPAYHAQQPAYRPQQPTYHQPVTTNRSAYRQSQSRPQAQHQESAPRPRPSHNPRG